MSAARETNVKETSNTLYCSFCGKSQHEVRKLVAGPTTFICDECVVLCIDVMKAELPPLLKFITVEDTDIVRARAWEELELSGRTFLEQALNISLPASAPNLGSVQDLIKRLSAALNRQIADSQTAIELRAERLLLEQLITKDEASIERYKARLLEIAERTVELGAGPEP